ncbi:urokinase plasminogen activator surface receptor-like [Salarias fasciatus]|uniref:Urokinase plasminogen activator surface receptor-like n=1 Tax=Salarias fasciatus TaxID=181472 RepID=A0A672HX47_SALFA|nr:urokinase plasminogen activator surface receptor-like [Salarias fasciatus]XP_029959442.1 urokinase plasminogen activator surface receptor-like [Salarias fasciatus]
MYLFSLILWVVLLPEASALKCRKCSADGSCGTQECIAGLQQCTAVRFTASTGDNKLADMSVSGCGSPKQCLQGSVNYGLYRTALTTKCCSTDLCNDQPEPEPSRSDPNGKKCFTCDGQQCNGTMNCLGDEDHCISATAKLEGKEITVKGCASQDMCSDINFPGLADAIGRDMKCCQGDFCNSASSTSAALLLLVVPLISLVLFS